MRWHLAAVFGFVAAGNSMAAQLPNGIPHDLTRQRAAQVSDVRYQLRFTITPHAPSVSGHEALRYRTGFSGPVLLDFRKGTAANPTINSVAVPVKIDNGHIELPANMIHASENVVIVDFTATVAPAG